MLAKEVEIVVMAKVPEPGAVKTRLLGPEIDANSAAEIAWAMLRCTVERLVLLGPVTLCIAPDGNGRYLLNRLGRQADDSSIRTADQGDGSLGERMLRVWRLLGANGPLCFLGIDSPDFPTEPIRSLPTILSASELAIGPTPDGGYWTLAGRSCAPAMLNGIDWGTNRVYDQTCQKAQAAGLSVSRLPDWQDVDRPDDLKALRRRLARIVHPAARMSGLDGPLWDLRERLERLCGRLEAADK